MSMLEVQFARSAHGTYMAAYLVPFLCQSRPCVLAEKQSLILQSTSGALLVYTLNTWVHLWSAGCAKQDVKLQQRRDLSGIKGL